MAPSAKPDPLIVRLTEVFACADVGAMLCTLTCVVDVAVLAEGEVGAGPLGVAVAGGAVIVAVAAGTVGVTGVDVAVNGLGVADAAVDVTLGGTVGETEVDVTGRVGDGMAEGVGVMNIGLPNSLHPRSGAAPANPVIGSGGTGSPLLATYCVTPLSIAGEVD